MATETQFHRPAAGARRWSADPAWAVLAVAGFAAFAVITGLLVSGVVLPFDQPLLAAARAMPVDPSIWSAISDSANLPLIGVGVVMVVILLVTGRRREAGEVIVVLTAVTAGSELIKQLVARPRPPGDNVAVPGVVYSYPSGHVLEALTIFGMIAILLWRTGRHPILARLVGVFAILFALLVAVARVGIDAHYPSDVLAAYVAGLGVIGVFALVARDPMGKEAGPGAVRSGAP